MTYRTVPVKGMRATISERMTASLRDMAQVTLEIDVDAGPLLELTAKAAGRDVGVDDVLIRAVALTLVEHPRLNGFLIGSEIRLYDVINVGFAVALDEGLVVPTIFSADTKDLSTIHAERLAAVERARKGALTIEEVTSATFSMTNLGRYRVDHFTPVVNPPQIAILGVGRARPRPVVVDGGIAARPVLGLSLTFDHRAVDGAPAAAFLDDLSSRLEAIAPDLI